MENYEFRVSELEVQNQELLAEISVRLKNTFILIHTSILCSFL